MSLVTISRTKSWMKRTGSWFSDVWAYLSNIQYLMEQQTNVQTVLISMASRLIPKATRIMFYNVKMVVADREYSQRLPNGTKGYTAQVTDGTAFRLQTEPGRVAGANRPYWSVPTNTSYDEEGLDLVSTTLYFASSTPAKTVEIAVKV